MWADLFQHQRNLVERYVRFCFRQSGNSMPEIYSLKGWVEVKMLPREDAVYIELKNDRDETLKCFHISQVEPAGTRRLTKHHTWIRYE